MRARCCLAVLVVTLGAFGGCMRPDGENGAVSEPFGNDQAVGLAVVLTDHQVKVGMAALQGGLNVPEIHAYAVNLIEEQTGARDRLLAVAAAQGLTADQSSTEAQSNFHDTMIDIGNHQDDGAYLADSVHDVGKAIEIWDASILPNVSDPVLRAELEATRQLLANQLAAGMQVLKDTGVPPKTG